MAQQQNGGFFHALTSPGGLQVLGAALSDIGSGGRTDNLAQAAQAMGARRKRAYDEAFVDGQFHPSLYLGGLKDEGGLDQVPLPRPDIPGASPHWPITDINRALLFRR